MSPRKKRKVSREPSSKKKKIKTSDVVSSSKQRLVSPSPSSLPPQRQRRPPPNFTPGEYCGIKGNPPASPLRSTRSNSTIATPPAAKRSSPRQKKKTPMVSRSPKKGVAKEAQESKDKMEILSSLPPVAWQYLDKASMWTTSKAGAVRAKAGSGLRSSFTTVNHALDQTLEQALSLVEKLENIKESYSTVDEGVSSEATSRKTGRTGRVAGYYLLFLCMVTALLVSKGFPQIGRSQPLTERLAGLKVDFSRYVFDGGTLEYLTPTKKEDFSKKEQAKKTEKAIPPKKTTKTQRKLPEVGDSSTTTTTTKERRGQRVNVVKSVGKLIENGRDGAGKLIENGRNFLMENGKNFFMKQMNVNNKQ